MTSSDIEGLNNPKIAPHILAYVVAWLDHQRLRGNFPGLSFAIVRKGATIFRHACGIADLETAAPLTPAHRFQTASHTKIATAAAVLKLAEEGKIELDRSVVEILPFLAAAGDTPRTITPRRILSHAAGILRDGPSADFWQGHAPFPDRTSLHAWLCAPDTFLSAAPNFKYSNIGYALLGLLIETVTGESWADYVRRSVLAPLGLETQIAPDSETVSQDEALFSQGYGVSFLSGVRPRTTAYRVATKALAPSAGFCAAPEALALLFSRLLHPARSMLTPETLEAMMTAQAAIPGMVKDRHYGYGVIIDKEGARPLYSHIGLWPGHMTKTFHDPARDLTLSVGVNCVDGNPDFLLRGVMEILAFLEGNPAPDPALNPFAGRFSCAYAVKDTVPVGDHLYIVSPDLRNPFDNPVIVRQESAALFRIVSDHGFGAQGEHVCFETAEPIEMRSTEQNQRLKIAGMTYQRVVL